MTLAAPRRIGPVAVLIAVLLAGLGPVGAGPASADTKGQEILRSLSGVWKGRGTARRSSTAAAEPISCRYEGKLGGDGLSLALNFVCLGVEFKFESRGSLTFRPDTDRFSVSLTVAGVDRRVEGSGRRKGSGVDLAMTGRHPETGKKIASRLTMSLSGARRMVNVLRSTDPETGRTFKAFQATFRR